MVRNSILLIDFAEMRISDGMSLREAVLESGAVRFRPIALTAGTVVVGAIPILLDPIFEGLAVALMGGAIASTILTLVVVPVVYFMIESVSRDPDARQDEFDNDEPGDMHEQIPEQPASGMPEDDSADGPENHKE